MRSQQESREEWEAKWIVSAVLSGRPERRTPSPEGTHDYDIYLDDRVVALVTTSTVPEVKGFHAAIKRRDWSSPWIRTHWQLTVSGPQAGYRGPSVDDIARDAPPLLHVLENGGISAFGRGHETVLDRVPTEIRRTIEALLRLGIISGGSVGPMMLAKEPLLLIGTVTEGHAVDENDVTVTAERAARRKERTLQRAAAVERHLFVVVEVTDPAAFTPLTAGLRLPDRPPSIPTVVDTVWIGAWLPRVLYGYDMSPIWRVKPPHAWERVDPPDAHGYALGFGERIPT